MQLPVPIELVDVLSRPNPCVIATVRPDGSPASSAVWYRWLNGEVLVSMSARSPRVRNLRARPTASLTVLDGPDWYRQVTVRGDVVAIEEDPGLVAIDLLSQHYEGRPYGDRNPEHRHVAARIRVTAWDQFGIL